MYLKYRNILFLFVIFTLLVFYFPVAVLGGLLLPERGAYYTATLWARWVIWALKHIAGISYRISGRENIPQRPCVVIAKHQSALDIFVLMTIFDPQTWVLKKELFNIPCFGWGLWATRPIAIDRSAGRQALQSMIKKGIKKLRSGFWVVIYPEGTRVFPGKRRQYKRGGAMLAKEAGVDIVPVALNTGLFWQKKRGLINTGVVDIVIGQAIASERDDVKKLMAKAEHWIEKNTLDITLKHPYYLALSSCQKSQSDPLN